MQAVKKAATILLSVVMWAIILVAALFAFTTLATRQDGSVANLLGFTPLTVQSDSMSPAFDSGDLIVIQQTDTSTLEVGDVITFHTIIDGEYALNTHRIAAIDELNDMRSFTTKGDNNEVADTHIIGDGDVVGKYVLRLPGMGRVMDFLSSTTGFLVVIVLPMLAFFIYQVYHLIMVSMSLKRAMAAEEREEQARLIVESEGAGAGVASGAVAAASDADAGQGADGSGEKGPDAASDAAAEAAAKLAEAEAKLAEAQRLKEEAERLRDGA